MPRRPACLPLLAALACGDPALSSDGEATDSDSPLVDPRFTLGPVLPCAAPQSGARWLDATDTTNAAAYPEPPPPTHTGENPGAMALLQGPTGEVRLAWVQPDGVAWRSLAGGEPTMLVEGGTPKGLSVADLDGDGVDDLILAGRAVAVIWSAADPAVTTGELALLGATRSGASTVDAAPGDLDQDGDLDLFVAWTAPDGEDREQMSAAVLRNDGGRAFTELPIAALPETWGPGFDVSLRDLNGDGALDAYLCQDMGNTYAPNVLLEGDGALGFSPVRDNGLDLRLSCMGASWGDVDADGVLELYIAESTRHVLLKAVSEGDWVELEAAAGLGGAFPSGYMAWGSALIDFDNDGQMELVVGTGAFWEERAPDNAPWWFERGGDGRFAEIGAARGLPAQAHARAAIGADLNEDGLPDLLLSDALRPPRAFLSTGCTADSWLEVAAPAGSEVWLSADGIDRAARIDTDSGWGAAGPALAHIGLGGAAHIDRLELRLPGGAVARLEGPIAPRRRITVVP